MVGWKAARQKKLINRNWKIKWFLGRVKTKLCATVLCQSLREIYFYLIFKDYVR